MLISKAVLAPRNTVSQPATAETDTFDVMESNCGRVSPVQSVFTSDVVQVPLLRAGGVMRGT